MPSNPILSLFFQASKVALTIGCGNQPKSKHLKIYSCDNKIIISQMYMVFFKGRYAFDLPPNPSQNPLFFNNTTRLVYGIR